jgi:hypothetical protein
MARTKSSKSTKGSSARNNAFQLREVGEAGREREPEIHVIDREKRIICDTESRGHKTPNGRSITEIVVDASEGFIPLWAKDITLRWKFRESSMHFFQNPTAAMNGIKDLLGEALLAWGDAAPVKFAQRDDAWDFEIVMRQSDSCDTNGCVLASAFFPDAGRHQLRLYPQMFAQERADQLRTLEHEIGHVFGLRHFFALISETDSPAEIFGTHKPFSIMNYGTQSVLTNDDKSDLSRLYQAAWSGELSNINGTPIRFVRPFHTLGEQLDHFVGAAPISPPLQPVPRAAYRSRMWSMNC